MLDITLTIEGDKIIIEGLNRLAKEMPDAVQRGLERSGKAIHRQAYQWLSGAGSHQEAKTNKKTGKKYTKKIMDTAAGGYPVPVRTGHLRRNLAWLKPGETKSNEFGSFTAGPLEVIIYNPVPYAKPIHEGTHTQKRHGKRPFITDAFEMFNRGLGVQMAINDEIRKARAKAGI